MTCHWPRVAIQGISSAAPDRRTSRLPRGRRRATLPLALSSEGRVLPRLTPSTRAMLVAGDSSPVPASEAISSTTATLEWHIQVSSSATSRASSRSPSRLVITSWNTGVPSTAPRVAPSMPRASSIRPRPISAQPMLSKRESSRRRKHRKPASNATGAASERSRLSSWTTRVEPILAPSITASAGARPRVPAAVKELAIRLTAVLLCTTPVMPTPHSSASQRLFRCCPSQCRSGLPKPRRSEPQIICEPHSNSAMAPARLIRRVVPDMSILPGL